MRRVTAKRRQYALWTSDGFTAMGPWKGEAKGFLGKQMMNVRGLTIVAAGLALLVGLPAASAQDGHDREQRRAERFIDLLDTNGDDKVSVAEIADEFGRLFGAADVDGDGNLSPDEFRRRGRLFQSVGAVTLFDMLDADSNQLLTLGEITVPSGRWVTRYDQNSDDALDLEEFPRRAHRGR